MNEEAPFDNVEHALRHAFAAEAKDTTVISQFLNDLRGSTVKEITGFTRWDHIAQAAMTIHLANQTLMLFEREFMIANYTLPIIKPFNLINKKELSCKLISYEIYERQNKWCDRWYVNDIVRQHCGLKRQHTDKWWSNHLKVNERKLRHYKKGRGKNPGIIPLCESFYHKVKSELAQAFYDAQIIKNVS